MSTINVPLILEAINADGFVLEGYLTTRLLPGPVGALIYEHLLKSGRLVCDRDNGVVRVGEGGLNAALNNGGIPLIAGLRLLSVSWESFSTKIQPNDMFQVKTVSVHFECYKVGLVYGDCVQYLAIPSQNKSECQFTLSLRVRWMYATFPTGSEELKCDGLIFEVVVPLNDSIRVHLHLHYELDRSSGNTHYYCFQAVDTV